MADQPSDSASGWSFDPTLNIDRLHIVESLDEPGHSTRTGRRLFEELESTWAGRRLIVQYHPVHDGAELRTLLLGIVSEAERGGFPMLHFEAHGERRRPGKAATSRGMVLASGELFSWADLAPYLVEINKATRLRLMVFMATCCGADLVTLLQPLKCAPARVMIGPRDEISIRTLEIGTFAFYQALRGGDGTQALVELNRVTNDAFLPVTADWLFLKILEGYYNDYTNERQRAVWAERIIAPMALLRVPPEVIAARRRETIAFLGNRKKVFDDTYRTFFFLDDCPENAERFRMTYETCFVEGTSDGEVGTS